ncbi:MULTISPECIES: KpsF/GutQ family sugar-phosphate isomerase [Lentibacter]|jgi:arabinose-5-phosphate isomerase|uniref:Arabinose-5-phosphate isomerase n=1 Tax=Lentibacter algarum TaxID=576131 RepID=A0A1H3MJS6_9RHOB|nr:KpsF/GutQ family sugar-phosphate isomerase [Lentibacter algarum]MCO4828105.1 KpsF/GutQ family sugar-phosphate isomerase [Lentibacter algarum]WIF33187.1 arabinose 5-phosphate isomerase KdsD [Lentibacter algarum]SDY76972.1 arabinose-5-phosphate isomerase [Lentibacter algarum]
MTQPDDLPIVRSARRVLQTEANAILEMVEALPKDFAEVVELILKTEGRVIISGVGKSGHIGRKISATLASTGTPSYFVHAAEASHGDLGMITSQDICLLISNSGETNELRDILLHTRRFNIPMIAISSNMGSTLMQSADFKLNLPNLPEACAIGMAPTTSTTLTLALGDAIAVAVMEQRGFGSEDFLKNHPGGKLGAQLSRVADLMHKGEKVPTVEADTPMSDVLLSMTSKGFGITGVLKGGILIGVISDGDLRRHMGNLMEKTAGEIATLDPVTITPELFAAQALALLNEKKISALMVVDEAKRPVGIVHIHDLLRAGVA